MSNKSLRCHAKNRFNTSYGEDRKRELHFMRQNARNEVKQHTDLSRVFGGVDTGCLQAAVTAKRGGR